MQIAQEYKRTTLLNMGFMSVYQLGHAVWAMGGEGETYNLDTENHKSN